MSAFVFKNVVLVDVDSILRDGNLLIFVTVMDKETFQQAKLLYFGETSVDALNLLRGSVVDCELKPSSRGFTAFNFVSKSGTKAS